MKNAYEKKETRTRTWTIIIYPDSAPANWRDIIDEQHIEWVESPLHDQDINADGEPKKPHIHVLLIFGGVKSYDQILEITERLHTVVPQRCHSLKGMIRYFCHLDNPEKHQYAKEMITPHGGADLDEYFRPSMSMELEQVREMVRFIRENGITSVREFYDYAEEYEYETWFHTLWRAKNPMIAEYIKANKYYLEDMKK